MEEMLGARLVARRRAVGPHHFFRLPLHRRRSVHRAERAAHRRAHAAGRSRISSADLVNYPQVLLNVRVREKVDLRTVPAVAAAIERVEARVEGQGRLLVRYSGTEPLLRVMLEGKHERRDPRLGAGNRRRRSRSISDKQLRHMVRLSVNVNKVATLRNSRGGRQPSVLDAVNVCLRPARRESPCTRAPTQRHITPADVREIARVLEGTSSRGRIQHRRRPAAGTAGAACTRSGPTSARWFPSRQARSRARPDGGRAPQTEQLPDDADLQRARHPRQRVRRS